jgi:hypothetical protein
MINLIPTAYAVDLGKEYPLGAINSLGEGFGYLVGPGFAIAAIAVVFYFLIGAFKILVSGGDKGAMASAQAMITHAIIGFILLMLMFIILQFIPQAFGLTGFKIIG